MRKIGDIERLDQAGVFSEYLYAKGMANSLEPSASGGGEIWVHDEAMLAAARDELKRFLDDPKRAEYADALQTASERRREEMRESAVFEKTVYNRRRLFGGSLMRGLPVTRGVILLSIVATLFGGLGSGSRLTQWLSISEYTVQEGRPESDLPLPEIAHGQVWRLLTPIFIHATLAGYGILHLLFNMLWLRDLGGMLEKAQGSTGMLQKILILGILSNLAQFFAGGPAFGGMSGVVFGLLGYIWMRGRLDLTCGLYVNSQTMMMMTFWFFLCLTGTMGPIANAAHAGGLMTGVAWGWLAARRVNSRQ